MKRIKLKLAFVQSACDVAKAFADKRLADGAVFQNVNVIIGDGFESSSPAAKRGSVRIGRKRLTLGGHNKGLRIVNLLTWKTVVNSSTTDCPEWVKNKDISGSGIDPMIAAILSAQQNMKNVSDRSVIETWAQYGAKGDRKKRVK